MTGFPNFFSITNFLIKFVRNTFHHNYLNVFSIDWSCFFLRTPPKPCSSPHIITLSHPLLLNSAQTCEIRSGHILSIASRTSPYKPEIGDQSWNTSCLFFKRVNLLIFNNYVPNLVDRQYLTLSIDQEIYPKIPNKM
jgi:hypothetical protein